VAFEENVQYSSTLTADADLSAKQFFGAKLSADGQVAVATAHSDDLIGIISNKPAAAGRHTKLAMITPGNTYKLLIGASETISIGDKLIPAADGWAEAAGGNSYQFIALEAVTTGAGESAVIAARAVAKATA
jgi:hypothetical protein